MSGGTAVAKAEGGEGALVDEGFVECDASDGSGIGGACVPFGPGDAIFVTDDVAGLEVAFQVCVDNNGDSVCTSPDRGDPTGGGSCPDEVLFSHGRGGGPLPDFFNPLGPLPTGFLPGCPGGPFPGYVVFLCEGVHVAESAHTHPATTGVAKLTTGGTGFGDFCGGTAQQPTRKRYAVTGGAGGGSADYVAGGTAVAKTAGQPPLVDSGVLQCSASTGDGVGGACLPFGALALDAVLVKDAVAGRQVAFQVCIDNDGDSVCTSPGIGKPCDDLVVFSHDDAGNFFNPLGPLPPGFAPGCPGGPFPGYVVFLCEGVHASAEGTNDLTPHAHPATTGTATLASGGTGFGDFCGGVRQNPSRKNYVVVR